MSTESREGVELHDKNMDGSNETTASPRDLAQALTSRNYDKTRWLLETFFDQVAVQEYSWLTELVQFGFSPTEITDELLEKATQGPWIHVPFEEPHSEPSLADFHQMLCVHNHSKTSDTPDMGDQAGSIDSGSMSLHGNNITIGSSDIYDRPPSQNDTQSLCESIESPSAFDLQKSRLNLTPRQRIEYLCGLGGVRPSADGTSSIELGSVDFDDNDSRALIKIERLENHDHIFKILDNLDRAAGELQRLGGCCDSFTCLFNSASENHVELHRVPFSAISKVRHLVSYPEEHATVRSIPELKVLGKLFTSRLLNNPRIFAHYLALATQVLALGLLSYAQAHCGPIQPFFLDTPLERISLLGYTNPGPRRFPILSSSLVELTCMGNMVGQPVFAFHWVMDPTSGDTQIPRAMPGPGKNLLASPEDLLDTWNPGYMIASIDDPDILYSVSVGGGMITSSNAQSESSATTQLHWSKNAPKDPGTTRSFHRKTKAMIGAAILENTACQSANAHLEACQPILEEMGTFPSYWEVTERQVGGGIQAGQTGVAALQFNQTWVKMPGNTKKSAMLSQREIYINDLESIFGVQVSICTGIARRVRLRDLLADLLPNYTSGLVARPPLWNDLHGKFDIIKALRISDIKTWLESLDHACRVEFERLVFTMLHLLRDTGVDRKGEKLVVACMQSGPPFQCIKYPCKKENYWARMLIDSEENATFAYVTTQCLETATIKCCEPSPWWLNSTTLLGTAVLEDRSAVSYAFASAPRLGQWKLNENEAYLIGRPDKALFVEVKKPDGADTQLLVSSSKTPQEFLHRFRMKGKPKRLREKKCFDSCAESVVVYVKKDGRSSSLSGHD